MEKEKIKKLLIFGGVILAVIAILTAVFHNDNKYVLKSEYKLGEIGYIDDIIVLWGLIYMAVRLIPDDVMEDCRDKSRGMWDNGKPKKW